MVYASSISVYGTRALYQGMFGRGTVNEDDPPLPDNLYGSTKLLCEGLALQARRQGLDVVGLRPVVTYGLGRLTGGAGILNAAMRDAALTGRGVVTQPWLPQARLNTMYVKDCADMFVRTCLHERPLERPVYNMGIGEYLSVREMMDLAEKSLPAGARIDFEPPSATGGAIEPLDLPDVDSSAIRTELSFSSRYSFESAARECIQAYLAGAT
jgi:UDP-glucose 4-epimerase